MPNPTLAALYSLDQLKTHLKTSLGSFYGHQANRLLLYFLLGAFFIIEGLLALAVYKGPSVLISHMAFATVYALHTALTYTCCQFLTDILACKLLPRWGCYQNRTVRKQWLVWSAGFVLAFVIHRTIILCLVHIYAPEVVAYYADPQRMRPSHIAALFYILPYWSSGVLLAVNLIIRAQKRLTPGKMPDDRNNRTTGDSLTICLNDRTYNIPYRQISHITVEDHYSRIYYIKENAIQNVFIRTTLKTLQQSLPDDLFLQIHRSHIVNLRIACGLSKNRKELKLKWAQDEITLPVSRYRLPDLRIRLKNSPSGERTQ